MSKPYMPLEVGNWLKGTRGMRAQMRGVYLGLLLHQWEDFCIPESLEELVLIEPEVAQVWDKLKVKFESIGDGKLQNRKLEMVRAFWIKQKQNGSKGGAKKFAASQPEIPLPLDNPNSNPNDIPISNPNDNPKHNHHIDIDNDIDSNIDNDKKKKGKREKVYVQEAPAIVPMELTEQFTEFMIMRKEKKKPMTHRAVELMLRELNNLAKDDYDKQGAILIRSARNGWTDVYQLPAGQQYQKGNTFEQYKKLINDGTSS